VECRRAGSYWTALSVALMMLSGCSTSKPPTGTLAEAEWGVRAAGEAKANDFALLDLNNARGKLEKAKLAMAAGNYDDARRFAESAQVDAELAQAKAEAAIFRRAADEVLKKGGAPATYPERESRKPLASLPDSDEAQKKGDAPPTDAERESRKPLTSAPEKE